MHKHQHFHQHTHTTHSAENLLQLHEAKTGWVMIISGVTMLVEIIVGFYTNSMALLADGWHMASHVLTLGLTWAAYVFIRQMEKQKHYHFDKERMLALSGFTSAVLLLVVAVLMAIESIEHFLEPHPIALNEAILVAIIGLVVNGISAFFLHPPHGDHDHNLKAAYLHVLADCLTSVFAIIALGVSILFDFYQLDALSGVISAIVVAKWAIQLMKNAGKELTDFHTH